MERLFYSTGQVASQLGVSLSTVRLLCENGVIKAETTPGGQWRIPESEVERLKRDGLPMVPRPLPIEAAPEEEEPEPVAALSGEVLSAQDGVAIARSVLEKRRIDREIEENEDWFRERQRQRETAAALEHQKTNTQLVAQRREQWMQKWRQYALDSVPHGARNEVQLDVHTVVTAALSELHCSDPDEITRRLVGAAVRKALRPWQRKQDIQRALKSAMNSLPWDIQNKSEWVSVKQLAWDRAVEAVDKLQADSTDREMAASTAQAVQPVIRAYEHAQASERIANNVYIFDATSAEREAAKKAVYEVLLNLPIGTTRGELEKASEAVLAPHKTAVAQRREAAQLESERQGRRRAAAWRIDNQLNHIERYLDEKYEFTGGRAELIQEAKRQRPVIREALIEAVVQNLAMSDDQIRAEIRRLVK